MKTLITFLMLSCCAPLLAQPLWNDATVMAPANTEIDVYRSPDCQCCHRWIAHLKQHGFNVIDHLTPAMTDVKQKLALPKALASCHTAVIDSYVVEGHVPAQDIVRLLTEKPAIKGLSVPHMPVGTPGMEMGARQDNFAVISFDKQNHFDVYNRYEIGADQQYHSLNSQD